MNRIVALNRAPGISAGRRSPHWQFAEVLAKAPADLAGGTFVDMIADEAHDATFGHPFKANVDVNKLEDLIKRVGAERIPYSCLATTVNMAGGQPASMQDIREVHALCKSDGIPVYFDKTPSAQWRLGTWTGLRTSTA